MTFDLLSTIVLTASATVVVATFVALFGSSLTSRISIGAAMAFWFIGVLGLGARGNIATPLLGAAVLIPIAVLSVVGFGRSVGRDRLQSAPLPALIALNVTRLLGVLFVLLYAAKRLPAPFAPVAGWGDIAAGAVALPLALWVAKRPDTRSAVLFWNSFGLADLVTAVTLGALSAPGPSRVFFDEPGSALMSSVPWILIPCFLVPSLSFVHLIVFYQTLRMPAADGRNALTATSATLRG
jgi:NADH:ubiquinone oxidoreductase subunit K